MNPNHLWLGTQKQNVHDRHSKGRTAKGNDLPNAKLTLEIAEKIRKKYKTGRYYQKDLAKRYGVDKSIVSLIVADKIWVN